MIDNAYMRESFEMIPYFNLFYKVCFIFCSNKLQRKYFEELKLSQVGQT